MDTYPHTKADQNSFRSDTRACGVVPIKIPVFGVWKCKYAIQMK